MRASRVTRRCLAVLTLVAALGCADSAKPPIPPCVAIPDPPGAQGAAPAVAEARPSYAVVLERHVEAVMRDGTKLYADVYRPDAPGRFPVLLTRTPYDRQGYAEMGVRAATRGYVVVLQDVRGRYESAGEWYPFKHESDDGYDSVEWAAALPSSNGKVGMFGSSYVGATQLLAAVAQPPHLKAIAPHATASDYHEGWTYQGGAFEQGFGESWTSGLAANTLDRRLDAITNVLDWTRKLPLASYPVLEPGNASALAPYFRDWLAHPSNDEYWRSISIERRYDAIRVPALHAGGWYDIFLLGTLRNFVGLKAHGGQRLVIGPQDHMWSKGEVDFGPNAGPPDSALRWFDSVLSDARAPGDGDKPVQIFVMGKNVWRGEEDWPLARASVTRYHLHAGRRLGTDAPVAEPPDVFVYDPADPAPTRGGPLCCDSEHLPGGAFDQRRVEAREDVLLFATPAMEHDVEVTGPVSVELFVGSSARDTDFTAKLVDLWPNGFAQNLTDGIVRMRFRESRETPSFLERGKVYPVTIDLAGTSNVFLAGHRMGVEISSSNFPRFDRNLNTTESPERGLTWTKATNSVFHDAAHASALVVSIVP